MKTIVMKTIVLGVIAVTFGLGMVYHVSLEDQAPCREEFLQRVVCTEAERTMYLIGLVHRYEAVYGTDAIMTSEPFQGASLTDKEMLEAYAPCYLEVEEK